MYEYRDRLKLNKIIKIKRLKSAEKYWLGIFNMKYLTFQSEAFYCKIIFIVRMFYTWKANKISLFGVKQSTFFNLSFLI